MLRGSVLTFREVPMHRLLGCTVIGLTLIRGGALVAQPPEKKEPEKEKKDSAKTPVADVSLADGSTVRITLVAESVELETKYGKLTIPAADIQHIEFAFRL